jgi:hypothetical protein
MTARATSAAVLFVAVIAAVVSFVHIEHLAAAHGQTTLTAWLLPLSIDGTVVAASMVMLRAARARLATPRLARFMLGLAVVATLAANIAYGLPYGLPGALISGWPAVAFIGCAEMAISAVRKMGPAAAVPAQSAPFDSLDAAIEAMLATTAAGNPLSGRQLEARFGLKRGPAARVRELVLASVNGHGPQVTGEGDG